jgi:hypothetical protein
LWPRWEQQLSGEDDLPARDRWARLRFAIIGPLLAAPPADGDLQAALEALAARIWRHVVTQDFFKRQGLNSAGSVPTRAGAGDLP